MRRRRPIVRKPAKIAVCVAVACLVAGCGPGVLRGGGSRVRGPGERDALVFDQFSFYVHVPGQVTGNIRENIRVRISEFKPLEEPSAPQDRPSRHRWVRTDKTGYYEMVGARIDRGYKITQVVLPLGNEKIDITFPFTPRPTGRVLNLGTMVCKINEDGSTDVVVEGANVYHPSDGLVTFVRTRHEGNGWDAVLGRRYLLQRAETGQ